MFIQSQGLSAGASFGLLHTRAERKVSSHSEYLENRSRGLDVTWQPVREDLTVHREKSLFRGASQSAVRRR